MTAMIKTIPNRKLFDFNIQTSQKSFNSNLIVFRSEKYTVVNISNVIINSKKDCINLIKELSDLFSNTQTIELKGVTEKLKTIFSIYGISDIISKFYSENSDYYETAA